MKYPSRIRSGDYVDDRIKRQRRRKLVAAAQRSASDANASNTAKLRTCSIESLQLEVGGARSRSYAGSKAHDLAHDDDGRVNFLPANPADKSGGDAVTIHWTLRRPQNIRKAELLLFITGKAKPIWRQTLRWKDDELRPVARDEADRRGPKADRHQGSMSWDGCFDVAPQGWEQPCVSAGFSPYKLKLRVFGRGAAQTLTAEAWTYFDVLIGEVVLDWEQAVAKDTIVEQRNDVTAPVAEVLAREKAICDDLHRNGVDDDHEILLSSNLFTTDLLAEGKNDTLYRSHAGLWGDGPLIPLFARIRLVKASGVLTDAPWALSGARFLWDWRDRSDSKHSAWLDKEKRPTKEFVRDSLDYYKALHAESGDAPRGSDNCHVEHGGKRGPGAKLVFPEQDPVAAGYDTATAAVIPKQFPFHVQRCNQRRWASTSLPRTSGVLAGRTGVQFQPSRMAGDCYRVSVYFVPHGDFPFAADASDLADAVADELQAHTGLFEVWRQVDVALLRKHANVAQPSRSRLERIYAAAGVRLAINAGIVDGPTWQQAFDDTIQDVFGVPGNAGAMEKYRDLLAPAVAAHTVFEAVQTGEHAINYRAVPVAGAPNPDDQTAFYTMAWNGMPVASASNQLMPKIQRRYIDAAYPGAGDAGAFTFLYKHVASVNDEQLAGAAHSPTSTRSRAAVYVAYDANAPGPADEKYGPGQDQLKGFTYVVAHEIGHAMFLAHAAPENGAESSAHLPSDGLEFEDNDVCLMNYHPKATRLCGLCILRLRGWACWGPDDAANAPGLVRLHNQGARNKVSFEITRVDLSLPATPPKTRRLLHGSDVNENLPQRQDHHSTSNDTTLAGNPPLTLLAGTVVNAGLPADPACRALAEPILLRATVNMPAAASVVWRVERLTDHDEVIRASPRALPTLQRRAGTHEATLLTDAIGSFRVLASVDPAGGDAFDPEAPCICFHVVMVGVEVLERGHKFSSKRVRFELDEDGDPTVFTHAGNHLPMRVRTRVRLLGGGADGQLGLDKIHGGWINNLTGEDSEATYHGPDGVMRAKFLHLHRRGDATWELLNPPLSAAAPVVDGSGGATMANWSLARAVLSSAEPKPHLPLLGAAKTLACGVKIWVENADGPAQSWHAQPPQHPDLDVSLFEFNFDVDFSAYLCFWTADVPLLAGVLEEVEWVLRSEVEQHKRKYKLRKGARVEQVGGCVHDGLQAAHSRPIEIQPPAGKSISHPRELDPHAPEGRRWM
ncbi:hypothetical protein DB30_04521 [Enhygromyxa salina]|uniref:Uncharacterized protein n=1 Tax=Enhygromyxa salina TaxID=215803 RepID=A0A0C1ZFC3_9BACT|nr:hypothetical protein DB30_04521 [Enhygromyxa salina]